MYVSGAGDALVKIMNFSAGVVPESRKTKCGPKSGPTLEILNGEYMGGSAQDFSNPHMLAMCYHSLALTLYQLNFSERT